MKKIRKMPLVVFTLLMVLLVCSISIYSFDARETEIKQIDSIEQNSKLNNADSIGEEILPELTDVNNSSEEQIPEENLTIEEDIDTSSNPQNIKTETTIPPKNSGSSNNSTKNNKIDSTSETKTTTDNIKKEEKSITSTNTNPPQNSLTNDDNISTDYYNYKTSGKWDYDTESICFSKGDLVIDKESNDILDYNELHMDAQISPDILNTECYPVKTDNGIKWFLQINCISGNCNEKYKSKYLK